MCFRTTTTATEQQQNSYMDRLQSTREATEQQQNRYMHRLQSTTVAMNSSRTVRTCNQQEKQLNNNRTVTCAAEQLGQRQQQLNNNRTVTTTEQLHAQAATNNSCDEQQQNSYMCVRTTTPVALQTTERQQ